jgi:hypothetical protein
MICRSDANSPINLPHTLCLTKRNVRRVATVVGDAATWITRPVSVADKASKPV